MTPQNEAPMSIPLIVDRLRLAEPVETSGLRFIWRSYSSWLYVSETGDGGPPWVAFWISCKLPQERKEAQLGQAIETVLAAPEWVHAQLRTRRCTHIYPLLAALQADEAQEVETRILGDKHWLRREGLNA